MRRSFSIAVLTIVLFIVLPAQQKRSFRLEHGEVLSTVSGIDVGEKVKLPFSTAVTAFDWEGDAPDRLMAATEGALWHSPDGGSTWRMVLHGLTVRRIAVSKKQPSKILCSGEMTGAHGTTSATMLSVNGGRSWIKTTAAGSIDGGSLDPDAQPPSGALPVSSGKQPKGIFDAPSQNCNIVWSQPVRLSDTNTFGFGPKIALSGDDTIHIVWELGNAKLPYRRSVNGGATFEPIREMIMDTNYYSGWAAEPQVLANGGKVDIIAIPGHSHMHIEPLCILSSNNAGSTWQPILTFASDTAGMIEYSYRNGDSILLSYYHVGINDMRVIYSVNGGHDWKQIATYYQPVIEWPRFALSSGMIHMVNMDYSLSHVEEVEYARSFDQCTTWQDSLLLSTDDSFGSSVYSITAANYKGNNEVWSAWRDEKLGHFGIIGADIFSRWNLNGKGWLPEQKISDAPHESEARLAIKKGIHALSSWYEEIPEDLIQVWVRLARSAFNRFCPPENLTGDKWVGAPATIALSSHAIHVLWEQQGEGDDNHFYIYYCKGEFPPTSAQLVMNEETINFDSTLVCHDTTDTLHLFNPGADSLYIGQIFTDNAVFSVSPDKLVIAPNDIAGVTVHFTPTEVGTTGGTIFLYHDGPTSPDRIEVSGIGTAQQREIVYRAGQWNMVSSPLRPVPALRLPSLFRYEHGYAPSDTIAAGRGYWAKPPAVVTYCGVPLLNDTLTVQKGWNIVGALMNPVAVASTTTSPDDNIESGFYGYNGTSYRLTDTLQIGMGYWVKAKNTGSIILRTGVGTAQVR